MKYDALTVMEDIVATQTSRLEIDVPGEGGRGWSRTESSIEVGNDATLDEQWREDISRGARHLREESYVRVSEPHYDAKVWPVVHPYGTGSMLAEPGAGSAHKHAKNRLVLIQSWFRKSALWSFWFLNRLITSELFFTNKKRQKGTLLYNSNHPVFALATCDELRVCVLMFLRMTIRSPAGRAGASTGQEDDPVTRTFGSAVSRSIPESTDWFPRR